jgi:hypothetical protein
MTIDKTDPTLAEAIGVGPAPRVPGTGSAPDGGHRERLADALAALASESPVLAKPPVANADPITPVLEQRGKRYGDWDVQAKFSQRLKDVLRSGPNWSGLYGMASEQCEALDMICVKISRILCGDPDHKDSWVDIEGYARLVSRRL